MHYLIKASVAGLSRWYVRVALCLALSLWVLSNCIFSPLIDPKPIRAVLKLLSERQAKLPYNSSGNFERDADDIVQSSFMNRFADLHKALLRKADADIWQLIFYTFLFTAYGGWTIELCWQRWRNERRQRSAEEISE